MPASRAAWTVAIERLRSSGRPSMDIGMPPRPIALTVVLPRVRVCIEQAPRVALRRPVAPARCLRTQPSPPQRGPVTDRLGDADAAVDALRAAGVTSGTPVALAAARDGAGLAALGRCWAVAAPAAEVVRRVGSAL